MRTNFTEDLKSELTRDLSRIGCKVSNSDSAMDLLRRWYDYEMRRIAPTRRKVEESRRFKESRNNLPANQVFALQEIIQELERGDDVNGHLSKNILNADRPDLLMADWRTYHIHISNSKKSPGDFFFDRADRLAFAIVNPGNVYFLDIFPHSEENVWSKDDLMKIVTESWPKLLGGHLFPGTLEPDVNLSSAERGQLRKAGITTPTVLGGSILFPPGGGITAAGTPVWVERQANQVRSYLGQVRFYLHGHPELGQQLADEMGCGSDELSLRLRWIDGRVHFQEEKSGKYLILDPDVVRIGGAEVLREKGQWVRQENGQARFTIPGLFSDSGDV